VEPRGATSPGLSGHTISIPPEPRPGAIATRTAPCPTSASRDGRFQSEGATVTIRSLSSTESVRDSAERDWGAGNVVAAGAAGFLAAVGDAGTVGAAFAAEAGDPGALLLGGAGRSLRGRGTATSGTPAAGGWPTVAAPAAGATPGSFEMTRG
jgi:hypothetical protein